MRCGQPPPRGRRLAENADYFERLTNALWGLAGIRLTVPMGRVDQRNKGAELQWRLVRLARAIAGAPAPPPLLTADQRLIVEAVKQADGTVVVRAPPSQATARVMDV